MVLVETPPGCRQPCGAALTDGFVRLHLLLPLERRFGSCASPPPFFFGPPPRVPYPGSGCYCTPSSTPPHLSGLFPPKCAPRWRLLCLLSPPLASSVCLFLFRVVLFPLPPFVSRVVVLRFFFAFFFFTLIPACAHNTTTLVLYCCGTSLVSVLLAPSPPWGTSRGVPQPCLVGACPSCPSAFPVLPRPPSRASGPFPSLPLLAGLLCALLLLPSPQLYLSRPHARLCRDPVLPRIGRLRLAPRVPGRGVSPVVRPRRPPLHQLPEGRAGQLLRQDALHLVVLWVMQFPCLSVFGPFAMTFTSAVARSVAWPVPSLLCPLRRVHRRSRAPFVCPLPLAAAALSCCPSPVPPLSAPFSHSRPLPSPLFSTLGAMWWP